MRYEKNYTFWNWITSYDINISFTRNLQIYKIHEKLNVSCESCT